jgi:hypothetical protein
MYECWREEMIVLLNYAFFTILGLYKHEILSLLCGKCRILQLHLSRIKQNVRIHVGKKTFNLIYRNVLLNINITVNV